jgi:phage terminase large subunit-like protein
LKLAERTGQTRERGGRFKAKAQRAKLPAKRPRGKQGGEMAGGRARKPRKLTPQLCVWLGGCCRNVAGYDPKRDSAGFHFDAERAWKAVEFFRCDLEHVKGEHAREPFELADWQVGVVGTAFGWVDEKGRRRYRQVLVYIPAKNGKTALAGGLVCYLIAEDGEAGAEIYSAACTREQAGQVFSHAAGMIKRSPKLSKKLKVYGLTGGSALKTIMHDETLSVYKALAADVNTADGANVHAAMIDELHRHPNGDLADILLKGTAARVQPIVWYLTTADSDRPSICNELHDYAMAVRDGEVHDPRFLPVLYEAPKDAPWDDEKVWGACNPNLGVSVKLDYLRGLAEKAKTNRRLLTLFRRLHLNQKVETSVDWISLAQWDAGTDTRENESPVAWRARRYGELKGEKCIAALDLSSTRDMTAALLWFPREDDSAILIPWYWLPREGLSTRAPRDESLLRAWGGDGFLTLTDGNVIDGDLIRAKMNDLARQFEILEVAMDPWNATQMATDLQADGFKVIEFRQGFVTMSPAAKEFEKRVLTGKVLHGGNPILRWNLGNCRLAEDPAGNIKPTKPGKDSPQKIDGIVCAVMCCGRAMVATDSGSVYEKAGLKSL